MPLVLHCYLKAQLPWSLSSFLLVVVCKNATNYSLPESTPLDGAHSQWFGADFLTCFGQPVIRNMTRWWLENLRWPLVKGPEEVHGAELDRPHSGTNTKQPAARGRATPDNAVGWGREIDTCCHRAHVNREVWDGLLFNIIMKMLMGRKKFITKQLHWPWGPASPWRDASKYNTSSLPLKKKKQ